MSKPLSILYAVIMLDAMSAVASGAAASGMGRIVVANPRRSADGSISNVTLAFGPSHLKRGLYRAVGRNDCGDEPAAWPSLERLKTIAPEATTAEATLPEGWGESVAAMRWFVFDEEVSPCYD